MVNEREDERGENSHVGKPEKDPTVEHGARVVVWIAVTVAVVEVMDWHGVRLPALVIGAGYARPACGYRLWVI